MHTELLAEPGITATHLGFVIKVPPLAELGERVCKSGLKFEEIRFLQLPR